MMSIFKYTKERFYLSTTLEGTHILSVVFTFLIYLFLKEEKWDPEDDSIMILLIVGKISSAQGVVFQKT